MKKRSSLSHTLNNSCLAENTSFVTLLKASLNSLCQTLFMDSSFWLWSWMAGEPQLGRLVRAMNTDTTCIHLSGGSAGVSSRTAAFSYCSHRDRTSLCCITINELVYTLDGKLACYADDSTILNRGDNLCNLQITMKGSLWLVPCKFRFAKLF